MAVDLPENIWFVRSNGGSGSYPIRPEGWRVVWRFVFGMSGWGVAGGLIAVIGAAWGPAWLIVAGPILFAAGAALSAWQFIKSAREHTDYTVTYDDYVRSRSGTT
jgi:hypothetical protein